MVGGRCFHLPWALATAATNETRGDRTATRPTRRFSRRQPRAEESSSFPRFRPWSVHPGTRGLHSTSVGIFLSSVVVSCGITFRSASQPRRGFWLLTASQVFLDFVRQGFIFSHYDNFILKESICAIIFVRPVVISNASLTSVGSFNFSLNEVFRLKIDTSS